MGNKIILIVANEPTADTEVEYNQWYSEAHIPIMFEFDNLKKVSRYRQIDENRESSKYLAIYEFENKESLLAFYQSAEFKAAVVDFNNKWQKGGFNHRWGASYELIQIWEK